MKSNLKLSSLLLGQKELLSNREQKNLKGGADSTDPPPFGRGAGHNDPPPFG